MRQHYFSFWTTTLDHVCLALAEVGIAYSRVDGRMTLKERQQSLASFTEDPQIRVLALSLRCGSTGYIDPDEYFQILAQTHDA